jgi:hypothetical protein
VDPDERVLGEVVVERIRKEVLGLPPGPAAWPQWVRFAVEFILMEQAVDRLQSMVDRYASLRAARIDRPIPEHVRTPLEEIVGLYLWGFDGPATALACSCFEVVAKHALIVTGKATEGQLKRERPGAEELRRTLLREDLLQDQAGEIGYLVRQRNAILHGSGNDERSEVVSRRCLAALVDALEQLHFAWPR